MIDINGAKVIIDYAHTPDAVEKIILSARAIADGNIYTIIGCGGERDKTKRPLMGSIVTNMSDFVLFTNDNPRRENECVIMNQILSGVTSNNYSVIFDRKEAIQKGISLLRKNDILLVLGKGHENYQILGEEKIHFSDQEVIKDYLQNKEAKLKLDY